MRTASQSTYDELLHWASELDLGALEDPDESHFLLHHMDGQECAANILLPDTTRHLQGYCSVHAVEGCRCFGSTQRTNSIEDSHNILAHWYRNYSTPIETCIPH